MSVYFHVYSCACCHIHSWICEQLHPCIQWVALGEQRFSARKVQLKGAEILGCFFFFFCFHQFFMSRVPWCGAQLLFLLLVYFDHYSIDTGQQRVNYKSSRSSLNHTERVIGGTGELELMGSLLVLRGSRADSRRSRKKWPAPPVRTGPVGWTDWHQIACVLLHSLLCPWRDANVWGVIGVCAMVSGREMLSLVIN